MNESRTDKEFYCYLLLNLVPSLCVFQTMSKHLIHLGRATSCLDRSQDPVLSCNVSFRLSSKIMINAWLLQVILRLRFENCRLCALSQTLETGLKSEESIPVGKMVKASVTEGTIGTGILERTALLCVQ